LTIYLDNASTSFPKPDSVPRAVEQVLREVGTSPGRSSGALADADRVLFVARKRIAELFNISNPGRIVFTQNSTMGLNMALKGILGKRTHVLTSSLEHNAVVRPLKKLEKNGVTRSVISCTPDGAFPLDAVEEQITDQTALLAMNHASNVTGAITPIREIGSIAKKSKVPFLVDVAQSAGLLPIDVKKDNIDVLACTGHKSLYGPQGTGFLFIAEGIEIDTLMEGGTGSHSDSEEMPDFFPDRFEAGTPNTPGIAGLHAGIGFIMKEGIAQIRKRELSIVGTLLEGLREISTVKVYGPAEASSRVSIVSFNVRGKDPAEVGNTLFNDFSIVTRVGLHCSPWGHKTIGTFPEGTVRVSVGYFNTESDIQKLLEAVRSISKE